MITLTSLLAALTTRLQADPRCRRVKVIETRQFTHDQFFLKVRTSLVGNYQLQTRVYYNKGHVDYAYQLFADFPLLRWDNKEEFPHLESFPHHHHDIEGNVKTSPLSGDPVSDLEIVLDEIFNFLPDSSNPG